AGAHGIDLEKELSLGDAIAFAHGEVGDLPGDGRGDVHLALGLDLAVGGDLGLEVRALDDGRLHLRGLGPAVRGLPGAEGGAGQYHDEDGDARPRQPQSVGQGRRLLKGHSPGAAIRYIYAIRAVPATIRSMWTRHLTPLAAAGALAVATAADAQTTPKRPLP